MRHFSANYMFGIEITSLSCSTKCVASLSRSHHLVSNEVYVAHSGSSNQAYHAVIDSKARAEILTLLYQKLQLNKRRQPISMKADRWSTQIRREETNHDQHYPSHTRREREREGLPWGRLPTNKARELGERRPTAGGVSRSLKHVNHEREDQLGPTLPCMHQERED